MSQADYEALQATGRLPATGETFISPSRSYAAKYRGVLTEFRLRQGATEALRSVGVGDGTLQIGEAFPELQKCPKGWPRSSALFKWEVDVINIGLGRGKALDIFHEYLVDFKAVPK
jgi:hypothetical protein